MIKIQIWPVSEGEWWGVFILIMINLNYEFKLMIKIQTSVRGERETSDRDSSSSRPSLTPHSDHSNWTQSQWFQNWTQSLTIQNWTQFLGQWFQTGTKGWSVTVISNRNHTLTPPCQSNNQQMKKGSGSETPSQTHPSLVKICEEATRTWSEFHLWPLTKISHFLGPRQKWVFVWISKVVGSTFTRHSLSSHQLNSSANVKQARQILNYSENLWPPVVK